MAAAAAAVGRVAGLPAPVLLAVAVAMAAAAVETSAKALQQASDREPEPEPEPEPVPQEPQGVLHVEHQAAEGIREASTVANPLSFAAVDDEV